MQKMVLERKIASAYHQLQYVRERKNVYGYLDSLYRQFAHAAQRRFELGETNYLEKITAQAKHKELQTQYKQVIEDMVLAEEQLYKVVQSDRTFTAATVPMEKLQLLNIDLADNPGLNYFDNRIAFFQAKSGYAKQELLPDISLNYFQGSNSTLDDNLYGYQLGLKIPLFFSGNASRIRASNIAKNISTAEAKDYRFQLTVKYHQLMNQLKKYQEALVYYEEDGQQLSDEILKTATMGYKSGEINFFQYIQSLENANSIILSYLENLNSYNQTVIALNYLTL